MNDVSLADRIEIERRASTIFSMAKMVGTTLYAYTVTTKDERMPSFEVVAGDDAHAQAIAGVRCAAERYLGARFAEKVPIDQRWFVERCRCAADVDALAHDALVRVQMRTNEMMGWSM